MNKIPRQFYRLKGELLQDTKLDKKGDVLHIYKNDNGYLCLNTRTGQYAYELVSTLRNDSVLKIIEITKED